MDDLNTADPVAMRAERNRRADHDGRPARIAELHESIARAALTTLAESDEAASHADVIVKLTTTPKEHLNAP